MTQTLVTGGAGFIGSHLCARLLSLGQDVICLDDLSTGSLENIKDLLNCSRFTFVEHDVREPFHFAVQRIFNLACPASPVQYQKDPVRTTMTSVMGTYNALMLARRLGARLLQASTSEIYGDPLISPQSETYWGNVNPIGPRSCYDEGKRCAETLCTDFRNQYGTDIRIARIFNTYGPRMAEDDGRVVSNFIVQALRGIPLTVYGDGLQERCFCFVSDLVEGLVTLMDFRDFLPGPVNFGNPVPTTILGLARAIGRASGSEPCLRFHDLPPDDPRKRNPDISQARNLLGWEPVISLEEGLGRTIRYFSGRLQKGPEIHLSALSIQ